MNTFRLALAVALVSLAAPASVHATAKFTSFMGGENCGEPASIDGNYAALADGRNGDLMYFDIAAGVNHRIGLKGSVASVKGTKFAFYGIGAEIGRIFVYDIPTAQVVDTGITTARGRWTWGVPSRYFSGTYVAFVDSVDGHVKYYSLADGTIGDTGLPATDDPTMDGNVVAAGDSFYDLATGQTVVLETGARLAVVARNVIAFLSASGEIKYRLIDSGQTFGTGMNGPEVFSTDGERIIGSYHGVHLEIAKPHPSSFLLFDISNRKLSDAGFTGCSDMSSCWVDISGRIVIYERWEGGTMDYSTGQVIYPPQDLNGDGVIGSDCVAGYTRI